MRKSVGEAGSVTVHLLDSGQANPVQTWQFKDCARIRIGRAEDNEISLAHPQVSRLHVELLYQDGRWHLHSRGRNGTQVGGAMVPEARLADRAIFQLGSSGPSFQLVMVRDWDTNLQTIDDIDPSALDFLMIDEQRKAEEVRQIADTEVFQQLREKARRLKQGDVGNAEENVS
jgi:pSer/pThr/pTyr-binding forkhead associated (FHA) protein